MGPKEYADSWCSMYPTFPDDFLEEVLDRRAGVFDALAEM